MDRDALHLDLGSRPVLAIDWYFFHCVECASVFCTVNDFADNGILAVEMILSGISDEKLSFVGVRSSVRTGDNAPSIKFECRADLVGEGLTPYRLSPFACACWIASLDHESFDVAMPLDVVIRPSSAMTEKIFCCSRRRFAKHFDLSEA